MNKADFLRKLDRELSVLDQEEGIEWPMLFEQAFSVWNSRFHLASKVPP